MNTSTIAELEQKLEKANEDFRRYKQEMSGIYAALDDERVDLVITATEAILELKAKLKATEAKIVMLDKLYKSVRGLCFGVDWNKGTHAKIYRKQIEAINKELTNRYTESGPLTKHDEAIRNQRIITDNELIDMVYYWHEGHMSALEFARLVREKCEGNQERNIDMLERVYECARQFLRFNGVDKERTRKAIDALDDAVEAVKTARENDENANEQEIGK